MRRLVAAATTGLTIALIALSLQSWSTALVGDGTQILSSLFTSPVDPPSTIGGTVFDDANGNGERDAGEPGLPGVTLKLRNGISGTITTDPNGNYSFSLAWSGYYTVTAMTPAGYANTTPEEVVARLTGPNQHVTVDFGYRGVGTVRGTVFDDRDIDETQDEGEPGVSGATITLLQGGSIISTTTTTADGTYQFASLFLGEYTVEETNPSGYIDTTPNTRPVTLTTPGQEKTVNFGDYGPSRVTGVVFNDLDGDSEQSSEEKGLPGVTVQLLRGATTELTATTDSNGVYFLLWDELGDYTVRETDLEGYVSTSPNEVNVSKTMPSQVETVNFADRGIGTIHGTVFDDSNGDGTQDTEESGIKGVNITLHQDNSTDLSTVTASDGSYEFVALGLGDYTVEETDPEGYSSTTPNVITASLTMTRQVAAVDFGDRGIGTIRGVVFDDQDGSQEQDPGEPGINGVTITLLQEGSAVFTTTTGNGGVYRFDPVWLGDYTVQETDREGYTSTTDNTATVSLTMTRQVEVRNFGDRGIGTIAGTVFSDENGNEEQDGEEQGIPDVTVTLLQGGSTISTTTTASDGSYAFDARLLGDYTVQETNPDGYVSTTDDDVDVSLTVPGQLRNVTFGDRRAGAIRGVVFDDQDGNQEQDPGEPGINGVTITLLQGGSTIETTTTSGNGAYTFDPVWLGEYTVRETDKVGYVSTTDNTATVSLTMTKQVEVRDFGDRGVGTIEGTVFSDQNGNGDYDEEEHGIGDVTVKLLQEGSTVRTTTTASDGSYAFASLFLGDYTVQETDPDGYTSTTANEVDISLGTPGERNTVDFGDRVILIYLPLVARGHP